MVPVLAFFILITIQLSAVFHGAMRGLSISETLAARAILEWETVNSNNGLLRPCLEEIEPGTFVTDDQFITVGAGDFRQEIILFQGVKVVEGSICIHE